MIREIPSGLMVMRREVRNHDDGNPVNNATLEAHGQASEMRRANRRAGVDEPCFG